MTKAPVPIAAILTRIVAVCLGLALWFQQAGALRLLHLDGAGSEMMLTPTYFVSLLAPIFFLAALWVASNALVSMTRDESFGPALVCGLKQMGWCLIFGAFAAIVVQPSLIFLIGNGFREMRGATFDLSVENLTLALVGMVLILLAQQARTLQSKLDEFV